MNKKDLATLVEIKDSLADPEIAQRVDAIIINNPAQEVEKSLVSFVTHRLNTLKKSIEYEDTIKEIILERIGEATFAQLLSLLEVAQSGTNRAAQTILTPFVSSDGSKTLPETLRQHDQDESIANKIYEETDNKQVLQAMMALNQLIESIKDTVKKD